MCSGIWKHPYSWHGRTRETSAASHTVATQGLRASCSRCTGSWTVRRSGAGRAGQALPFLTRMALNGKHWPTTEAPMEGWAYGVHSWMWMYLHYGCCRRRIHYLYRNIPQTKRSFSYWDAFLWHQAPSEREERLQMALVQAQDELQEALQNCRLKYGSAWSWNILTFCLSYYLIFDLGHELWVLNLFIRKTSEENCNMSSIVFWVSSRQGG